MFKHHSAPVTSVEWHPKDSTVFASAGADDQVLTISALQQQFHYCSISSVNEVFICMHYMQQLFTISTYTSCKVCFHQVFAISANALLLKSSHFRFGLPKLKKIGITIAILINPLRWFSGTLPWRETRRPKRKRGFPLNCCSSTRVRLTSRNCTGTLSFPGWWSQLLIADLTFSRPSVYRTDYSLFQIFCTLW